MQRGGELFAELYLHHREYNALWARRQFMRRWCCGGQVDANDDLAHAVDGWPLIA